jgi:hypothetical protein
VRDDFLFAIITKVVELKVEGEFVFNASCLFLVDRRVRPQSSFDVKHSSASCLAMVSAPQPSFSPLFMPTI